MYGNGFGGAKATLHPILGISFILLYAILTEVSWGQILEPKETFDTHSKCKHSIHVEIIQYKYYLAKISVPVIPTHHMLSNIIKNCVKVFIQTLGFASCWKIE